MSTTGRIEGYFGSIGGLDLQLSKGASSLIYTESCDGIATCRLTSHVYNWSHWDQVVRGKDAPIWLRWGVDSGENQPTIWGEWRQVFFPSGNINYRRDSATIDLVGFDYGYFLSEQLVHKVYKEMRISDMVGEIAKRSNYSAKNVVCPPTDGKMTIYQCGMTDFQMLKYVLLPRAVSVSGNPDYYFFTKYGTTIYFSYPDLSVKPKYSIFVGPNEPTKRVGDQGEVNVEFGRAFLSSKNAWVTGFRGFDPESKTSLWFAAEDSSVPMTKLAPTPPPTMQDVVSRQILLTNDIGDPAGHTRRFENRAMATWAKAARDMFSVTVESTPLIDLAPLDIVDLSIKDSQSKDHFLSGHYLVHTVKQKVSKVGVTTSFDVRRRESYSTNNER